MFRSVHFPIHISDIVKETESGKRCTVDLDAAKIYFQEFPNNINTSEPDELKPENMKNNTIYDTLQEFFLKKQTSCLKSHEMVMTLRLYCRHFKMEH